MACSGGGGSSSRRTAWPSSWWTSGGGNLTLAAGLKLKLKQGGELGLISGLYAIAPFIGGQWPAPDCPSSAENNGIFIGVHTNRATVGYRDRKSTV